MFYFLWALKNLYRNKKRTLGTCALIIIVSLVLFLDFAFLKGTQKQMKETMREYLGDISLRVRSEDYNLAPVKKHLENGNYKNSLERIISGYSIGNVSVISEGGYLNDASIAGYSNNYFKWLKKNVEWIEGGPFLDNFGHAVIEKSMAEDLGISAGERVTVEYVTPDGAINTDNYQIVGVFIGNKYEDGNTVYVSLKDAQSLAMVKDKINTLKIYLKNPEDEALLQQIVDKDLKSFSNISYISVWRWETEKDMFYSIFQYGQIFNKLLLSLVSIVLLIILFFGIQNVFYLIFNKRANEISVLTTYGMPFLKIYKVIFWETIVLFSFSLAGGFLLSLLCGQMLSGISMARISDEMVIVLGGPNLQFDFVLKDIVLVTLFVYIVGLFSTLHSLRRYFKLEVREMVGGIR